MIYASQEVAGDPKPWRYVLLDPNGQAREATQVTGGFIFDPRPEYTTKHPANPILVAYRKALNDPTGYVKGGDTSKIDSWFPTDYTPEQLAHAGRVLIRLASMSLEAKA